MDGFALEKYTNSWVKSIFLYFFSYLSQLMARWKYPQTNSNKHARFEDKIQTEYI